MISDDNEGEKGRLDQHTAQRILELAANLDQEMGSHISVRDLRAAAVEAGISNEAFDLALQQMVAQPPLLSSPSTENKPSWWVRAFRRFEKVIAPLDAFWPKVLGRLSLPLVALGLAVPTAAAWTIVDAKPLLSVMGNGVFVLVHLFMVLCIASAARTSRLSRAITMTVAAWVGVWATILGFSSDGIELGVIHLALSLIAGLGLLSLRKQFGAATMTSLSGSGTALMSDAIKPAGTDASVTPNDDAGTEGKGMLESRSRKRLEWLSIGARRQLTMPPLGTGGAPTRA